MQRPLALILLFLLASCGQPSPATHSEGNVAPSATARPTRTRKPTRTPSPTPTALPTASAEPTPQPQPSLPTAAPPIIAQTTRATGLFEQPNEKYQELTSLNENAYVQVLYRGGQWFQVRTESAHVGWLYRDWLDLSAEDASRVPTYPESYPVYVGKVARTDLADGSVFSGKIYNVGAKPAYNVIVEIELKNEAGDRVELIRSPLGSGELAPEAIQTFEIRSPRIAGKDYSWYYWTVRWCVIKLELKCAH